jgi:flagellin-like hook-associated protein FlgL
MAAASSRIRDTDYANATAELTASKITSQAAVSTHGKAWQANAALFKLLGM